MSAFKSQVWGLEVAVFFVRVTWWHVKWLVDFEAPGTALDWFLGWHFGEKSGSRSVCKAIIVVSMEMKVGNLTYLSILNCIFSL